MPAKIKNGSYVEQIVTPVKGFVSRKELVGDDILVFVIDEADGHEKVLHEDNLKVLREPEEAAPQEGDAQAATGDQPTAETPAVNG